MDLVAGLLETSQGATYAKIQGPLNFVLFFLGVLSQAFLSWLLGNEIYATELPGPEKTIAVAKHTTASSSHS